jgi:hypothetical protein
MSLFKKLPIKSGVALYLFLCSLLAPSLIKVSTTLTWPFAAADLKSKN